jgi:hypothetical protein
MTKFALIEEFQNPNTDDKTPLPRGLKYQEYELSLYGEPITVFVPLKESAAFEQAMPKRDTFNRRELKHLLHKFRGIRG